MFDWGHIQSLNKWDKIVYCVVTNGIHVLHPYYALNRNM